MDTVEKLLTWVIASDGNTEAKAAAKALLRNHFEDQDMDTYKLNQIVNTGSMLSMIIAPIRYAIVHDPVFEWCSKPASDDCHTSILRK